MDILLFKKRLDHARDIKADGAQLISLYIPPGKPISDVRV
jgi:peptide subunit release factor 1 (eRF1)